MTTIIPVLEVCTSQVMPTTMEIIESGQLGVTSMSGPYGAFVAVLSGDDGPAIERTIVHEVDLYPIFDKARKHGCHWIHFDKDADVDPDLPDYLEHWT